MFGYRNLWKAVALLPPLLMAATLRTEGEQYICSLSKGVECDRDLNCGAPAPQLPPPTFIHVDVDDSRITLLAPPERRGETTQIRAVERDEDRLILSGIEAGRAWSLSMSESNGDATIAINFGGAAMIVFGQCLPAAEVSP